MRAPSNIILPAALLIVLPALLFFRCQQDTPATVETALESLIKDSSQDTIRIGDTLLSRNRNYTPAVPVFDIQTPGNPRDFLVELEQEALELGEHVSGTMTENEYLQSGRYIFNKNCMTCHSPTDWRKKENSFFTDTNSALGSLPAFSKDQPKLFNAAGKTFVHRSLKQRHENYFILKQPQRQCLERYLRVMNDTTAL